MTRDSLLPYTIHFENDATGSNAAPAQQVFLTDWLTNLLDWQTFELTEIAFGDVFLAVPPGTRHFEKTVPMRFNGVDFEVQVEAGIRLATGEVYATFRSIVPTTGLPPADVEVGFLPPENGTGRGQGHIGYVVRAHANLTTGTEIRNVAFITFDIPPAIRTDQVDPHDPSKGIDTNKQALVTIDADLPMSLVSELPSTATNTAFVVNWTGSDIGSGVASYDLYVQTNGGSWTLWLSGATGNSATFFGQNAKTYGFYTIAHDGAGNVEPAPSVADAITMTLSNYPPVIDPVTNRFIVVGQTLTITNFAYDPDGPVTFRLDPAAPAGASITTNGVFKWAPACSQGSTTNVIKLWATDNGGLSNSVSFVVTVSECVQVGIGSLVLQVGQNGCVPVNLLSTVGLTNLSFVLAYPTNRFTNWVFHATNAAIGTATVQTVDSSQTLFHLGTKSGQVLQGPALAGTICFDTVSNSSAFVPLLITNIQGTKSDGVLVGNTFGQPGRVVLIGREPLLEAWLAANSQRMLTLYGNPGASYLMHYNTNLATTNWSAGWRVPLTNLVQTFEARGALPQVFYRAEEFAADPPILEFGLSGGGQPTLLLYGRSGTNYTVLVTTNLSGAWLPVSNFTLPNSFRFMGTGNPTNGMMFFKATRP